MKKLFALALAALMVGNIAMTQPVFAEEAAALELNWSDFEEQVAASGVEGTWYTFNEIAVQMWVPDVLLNTELTEEDQEAGYIGYFQTEDQSAAIGVQYVDLSGMSLEDYAAVLPDYGASEIEIGLVNGLPAASYTLAESDTMAVTFMTEKGYAFEVSFAPMSDEGFQSVAALTAASIQPYEEGAEAEAEEGAEESAEETEAAE